jgi:hypothetical protein
MNKIATVLTSLTIGAAAIGIGIAPPAAADPTNCETVGGSTVCGQGDVRSGGEVAGPPNVPAPAPIEGGCQTPYGSYQNCNIGGR